MSDDPSLEQTEDQEVPIVDVEQLNQDLPDEYQAEKVADEEGGVGAQYSVPTSSYSAFKNAVNGRGYDIDNHYGWQCWDGGALLWQQFGLGLITGNGLAIGCWDLKRNQNKGSRFDLVTSVNSLKPGDLVCMRPNHMGYFDGFDGAYMRILGQNQGGRRGPSGGMAFNLVRITKSAFAGAFRLKAWNKPAPAPAKKVYIVVKPGWGLSNVARAAGFKDYGKDTRWAAIANLNGSGNWRTFNARLQPGQKVRVK